MNRRRAIFIGFITGTAGLGIFSSVKWFEHKNSPNLQQLGSKLPLLDELAEIIIPKTNTPGAKEAGVGSFILYALFNLTSPKNQRNFLNGLQELEQLAIDECNKGFIYCNKVKQIQILTHFENKGKIQNQFLKKVKTKLLGADFFSTLKKYTVWGYCTSNLGATRGMSYDQLPGKFIPILTLQPGQKAWATK